MQPSFETPTDTMTVSLNVGRVRRDVSYVVIVLRLNQMQLKKIYIAALKLHDFTQRFRLVIPHAECKFLTVENCSTSIGQTESIYLRQNV